MSAGGVLPAVADAVRRYASYLRNDGRQRRDGRPGVMAPWDENLWFENIIENVFALPNVPPALEVAPANPRRVAIAFASNSTTQNFVSTNGGMLTAQGFQLNTSTNALLLIQAEHGPLVAQQWFGFASTNGNQITVFEVILRDWPRG